MAVATIPPRTAWKLPASTGFRALGMQDPTLNVPKPPNRKIRVQRYGINSITKTGNRLRFDLEKLNPVLGRNLFSHYLTVKVDDTGVASGNTVIVKLVRQNRKAINEGGILSIIRNRRSNEIIGFAISYDGDRKLVFKKPRTNRSFGGIAFRKMLSLG